MIDIEKILKKFEKDLSQFKTVEEKYLWLKQQGFAVKMPPKDTKPQQEDIQER